MNATQELMKSAHDESGARRLIYALAKHAEAHCEAAPRENVSMPEHEVVYRKDTESMAHLKALLEEHMTAILTLLPEHLTVVDRRPLEPILDNLPIGTKGLPAMGGEVILRYASEAALARARSVHRGPKKVLFERIPSKNSHPHAK